MLKLPSVLPSAKKTYNDWAETIMEEENITYASLEGPIVIDGLVNIIYHFPLDTMHVFLGERIIWFGIYYMKDNTNDRYQIRLQFETLNFIRYFSQKNTLRDLIRYYFSHPTVEHDSLTTIKGWLAEIFNKMDVTLTEQPSGATDIAKYDLPRGMCKYETESQTHTYTTRDDIRYIEVLSSNPANNRRTAYINFYGSEKYEKIFRTERDLTDCVKIIINKIVRPPQTPTNISQISAFTITIKTWTDEILREKKIITFKEDQVHNSDGDYSGVLYSLPAGKYDFRTQDQRYYTSTTPHHLGYIELKSQINDKKEPAALIKLKSRKRGGQDMIERVQTKNELETFIDNAIFTSHPTYLAKVAICRTWIKDFLINNKIYLRRDDDMITLDDYTGYLYQIVSNIYLSNDEPLKSVFVGASRNTNDIYIHIIFFHGDSGKTLVNICTEDGLKTAFNENIQLATPLRNRESINTQKMLWARLHELACEAEEHVERLQSNFPRTI